MPLLKIPLSYDEQHVLDELAACDLRQPVQVMRWLLRSEGARRGFLNDPNKHESATPALQGSDGGNGEVRQPA